MKVLALLGLFLASAAQASWLEIVPDHANGLYNVGEFPKLTIKVPTVPTNADYSLELTVSSPGATPMVTPISGGLAFYQGLAITQGVSLYSVSLKLLGPQTNAVLESKQLELVGQ